MLEGFEATYTVTQCAYNCSGHGQCDVPSRLCACENGYKGIGCQIEFCPDMCGQSSVRGVCNLNQQRCDCRQGYTGYDCSLSLYDTEEGQSTWHNLSPHNTGLTGRAGHAAGFIDAQSSMYIFGGNTLNELLDDLMRFNLTSNTWESMTKTWPWPSARHGHAIVEFNNEIYMYGGILSDGSHSSELWHYDSQTNIWTLKAQGSSVATPGVSSHALTVVENQWLYLFGGRTQNSEFLSSMYRFNLLSGDAWEEVVTHGGKEADRRLVGHSMVYHPESKSLLVFGGFLPDYARFPKRMNTLHAFHVEERYWSQIQYEDLEDDPSQPKDRAFHTANIMGNYMVIYGGNYHIHHQAEVCYDANVYFYHLGCHRWVNLQTIMEPFPGNLNSCPTILLFYLGSVVQLRSLSYDMPLLCTLTPTSKCYHIWKYLHPSVVIYGNTYTQVLPYKITPKCYHIWTLQHPSITIYGYTCIQVLPYMDTYTQLLPYMDTPTSKCYHIWKHVQVLPYKIILTPTCYHISTLLHPSVTIYGYTCIQVLPYMDTSAFMCYHIWTHPMLPYMDTPTSKRYHIWIHL